MSRSYKNRRKAAKKAGEYRYQVQIGDRNARKMLALARST